MTVSKLNSIAKPVIKEHWGPFHSSVNSLLSQANCDPNNKVGRMEILHYIQKVTQAKTTRESNELARNLLILVKSRPVKYLNLMRRMLSDAEHKAAAFAPEMPTTIRPGGRPKVIEERATVPPAHVLKKAYNRHQAQASIAVPVESAKEVSTVPPAAVLRQRYVEGQISLPAAPPKAVKAPVETSRNVHNGILPPPAPIPEKK